MATVLGAQGTISVPSLLNRLARVREDRDQHVADINSQIAALQERVREAVPELAAQIVKLRKLQVDREAQLGKEDKALAEAIASSTVSLAKTQRGDTLMAVYSKPRIKLDSKGLQGYAVAHPKVKAFISYGKPSVSIRRIKGK